MEETKENLDIKNQIRDDFNNLPNRATKIVGASASIAIITLILKSLGIIPSSVALSLGFFTSLPLIYSFIFGIITNRPNFSSALRHYSFLAYLIISLIIYLVILKPDSLTLGIKYFFHFFLGLVLAVIGYFCYIISYRLLIKKSYRIKASISFGVSLIITFIVAFILNHYKIFELIK